MSRFVSLLAPDLDDFLEFKRARACKYARAEKWLRAFDRFVAERARVSEDLHLEVLVPAWIGRNADRSPVTVANEFIVIRKFCEFRQRRDPRAFVPPSRWVTQSCESEFKPYILTDEEIGRLLSQAAGLTRPPFRARLYRALLLVLVCTGIRIGEALRLRFRDVDLSSGVLYISESKGRARWVPMSRSLVRELEAFREARAWHFAEARNQPFLVGANGRRLPFNTVSETVRSLFRRAGIKPMRGRVGPRIHDLRHTFAVSRLARWHRAGVDVQAHLPLLSAYMGHDSILGTEKYLNATPELLEIAADRLRLRLAQSARSQ